MISSEIEYNKAKEELEYLRGWAARLVNDMSSERAGITLLSVRSMISRVAEEIANYEASKPVADHPKRTAEEQEGGI